MQVKDCFIISEKSSNDETKAINKLSNDLQNWFDDVLNTLLKLITANDDEALLLYQVEQVIKHRKDNYIEILSDNIQEHYINTSYNVEASINNKVASKSLDNYMLIQSVQKGFDYQSLIDEWLDNRDEINKQIQKKLRYGNNTQSTLNRYIALPERLTLTGTELLEWEIDEAIIDYMSKNVFTASESTLNRVTQDIYNIIKESYAKEGNGVQQVRNDIIQQFDELKKYEAERIARTETLKAQESATYNRLINNEAVEYIQWLATDDDRTRDSHAELDGEITYADGTGIFSNGLKYPGDTDGDIEEWINCRCTLVAFVPDVGFVPPVGVDNWYEDEMLFDTNVFNIDIPALIVEDLGWV